MRERKDTSPGEHRVDNFLLFWMLGDPLRCAVCMVCVGASYLPPTDRAERCESSSSGSVRAAIAVVRRDSLHRLGTTLKFESL